MMFIECCCKCSIQLATTVEAVDFESEKPGSKRKSPGKDYEYMPETYDGCKDRYGLVFRNRLNVSRAGSWVGYKLITASLMTDILISSVDAALFAEK